MLTWFELRKVIRRKSFIAAIALVVGMAVFMALILLLNAQITGKEGKFLHGTSAIKLRKEYNLQLAGPLTTEKIEKAISHDSIKNEQIYSLVSWAYSPADENDFFIFKTLTSSDVKRFYEERMERVNEYLNGESSNRQYSMKEKSYFVELNNNIATPFQLDYVSGWQNLFDNLPNLFLMVAFAIAICLAPVFVGEYHQGTDSIILSTRYGRSKVISAKMKAGFLIAVFLTILGVAVYSLLVLKLFGFAGGDASVQIIKLLAPVPYTVLQTYKWAVLIGSLACLMVAALTLWLSSLMRSPFAVIITVGLILMIPMLIPVDGSNRYLNHIVDLFPSNMFDSFHKVIGYDTFQIFGRIIPEYKVMGVFAMLVVILLCPFTYRAFKNHQVV